MYGRHCILLLALSLIFDIFICSAQLNPQVINTSNGSKCFVRRLNCQQQDVCCGDKPSMEVTFKDQSAYNAFALCTWICRNDSKCKSFNFIRVDNTCQVFYNISIFDSYKTINGCIHMYDKSQSTILF